MNNKNMSKYMMSREHGDNLRKNRVFLTQNINDLETVLGFFRQEKLMSKDMCERILVEKTTMGKVGNMLDVLTSRGGPTAYSCFINALKRTGTNEHVIQKLSGQMVCSGGLCQLPPLPVCTGPGCEAPPAYSSLYS